MSSVSGYDSKKKKRMSMRKFLGGAVRKTADVAKSLAAEATKKKQAKEPLPPLLQGNMSSASSSRDVEKLGRLSTDIVRSTSSPSSSVAFSDRLETGRNPASVMVFKRIQAHRSGPFDFEAIQFSQELASQHLGPIWCMRFSQCGQLLATAGQDTILRIWVIRDSHSYFKGTTCITRWLSKWYIQL